MKEKKSLIYIIIIMIIILGVAKIGYNYFSKNYKNEEIQNASSSKFTVTNKSMAQDFTVYNTKGEKVKLSDYRGKKPVVINFWASWCPPCKEEMPLFQEATNKYANDNIEILMINLTDGMRETRDNAINYMKENKFNMNVMFDTDMNAVESYNINSIPQTMFVDKEGYIVGQYSGAIDKQTTLNKKIEELLNK